MREPRRYVITDAGHKQYVTNADDIQWEYYCHVCGRTIEEQEHIALWAQGGRTDKSAAIPTDIGWLKLHPDCTPPMLLGLMVPPAPET